jgi:DNA polymerase I-like protein with 3'-5' exonuclease and polymerase domains
MQILALDTETTGLNTEHDRPFCATTCTNTGETNYVYLETDRFDYPRTDTTYIYHGAKFDIKMLGNIGYDIPEHFEDVMLMSHLLNEYTPNSLEYLSLHLLEEKKYEDPLILAWLKKNKADVKKNGYLNMPEALLKPYAIKDAVSTMKLYYALKGAIVEQGLQEIYEFEKQILRQLIIIERNGMLIDIPYAFEKVDSLQKEMQEIEAALRETYKIDNPRSPLQVKASFHRMGVMDPDKPSALLLGTAMPKLNKLAHPLAFTMKLYRRIEHMHNKFLLPLLRHVEPKDHMLHANFNQHIAKTGRLSSSDPNIQNAARPEEEEDIGDYKSIARKCFIVRPGHYLAGADYDQMEMRLNAEVANDPKLIKLFNEGTNDIYVDMAKIMWPGIEITKYRRWSAKQTVLGMSFGMGVKTFVAQAAKHGFTITLDEAKNTEFIFHGSFPAINEKIQELASLTRRFGFVVDRFGRRYRVPSKLAYKAFNAIVQGSAAHVMKRALLILQKKIDSFYPGMRIINCIHDEILCEVSNDIPRHIADDVIVSSMEEATLEGNFIIPITAEAKKYGKSWGETA